MIVEKIKSLFQKKIVRRLLGFLVVLGLSGSVFFVGTNCYADETPQTTQEATQEKIVRFNEIAHQVINICYALLRPIIRVCGIALDNSLVYGSRLHIDASLWSLRNVMKNFANYILGFLVIIAILRNLFTLKGMGTAKDKRGPLSVIKNTLIAGVLIQMSRFLVAAIIDVSSILTYSIGGLPTTLLKSNNEYKDTPVMGVSASLMTNDNGTDLDFYYTYGDHKIYNCKVVDNLPVSGSYIVGPEKVYLSKGSGDIYFDTGYCALGGWPYKYKHDASFYPDYSSSTTGVINDEYKLNLKNKLDELDISGVSGAVENCIIIPIADSKQNPGCIQQKYGPLSNTDSFFVGDSSEGNQKYTISNLIEKSKGYVGQLITIYSSILDYSTLSNVKEEGDSYMSSFVDLIFRLFFAVVLFLPLLALAVILVIRVGILWIVISCSPILIIGYVFKNEIGGILDIEKIRGGKLGLKSLISLIFAPVIVTFAIGISLIFMTAITKNKPANAPGILESFGIQEINYGEDESTYSVLGLFEFTVKTKRIDATKDNISYFITMLLATGVIRFFLMAAVKATGKLGETIGDSLQKKMEKFAGAVPILPIAGGVGITATKEAISSAISGVTQKMEQKSKENLYEQFKWLRPPEDEKNENNTESAVDRVVTMINENKSLTEIESKLTKEQKQELQTITGAETVTTAITTINNFYQEEKQKEGGGIIGGGETAKASKQNSDALKYTREQLDNAVKYDPNWRERASSMIGGAVHTNDGVFIVDVVSGTELTNPVYKIVTRDEYEKAHFGNQQVENIDKSTFDKWKSSSDAIQKKQATELEEYLKKMKELQKKYDELQKKADNDKTEDDKKMLEKLKEIFVTGEDKSKFAEKIITLLPDNPSAG